MKNDLVVKEVNFKNVNMVACKDDNEKVSVSIRSICNGLGVAYNGQMERINRDDVLPQGVRKIRIPTSSGEQEVNMLDIEFLPFFLTGIKTTMVKPEIAFKIIEFKLKAKDVLAKAFIKPKTAMEELKLHYQALDEVSTELCDFKEATNIRFETLENTMTIDFGQQRELQNIARKKAIQALGGKESPAYQDKGIRTKIFSGIWKDFKDYFQINSYRNTPRKELDKAKEYLKGWQVQGKLLREVEDLNGQISFVNIC